MKLLALLPLETTAAAALLLFSPTAAAQEWVGFGRNCPAEISSYSRNNLGNGPGEVMTRIDSAEHTGWGTFGWPFFRVVDAVSFAVMSGPTPQTIDIGFYTEGAPDLPVAAPVAFAVGLPIPPAGIWCLTVVGPPASIPITPAGDVFLSFDLPAAPGGGWPGDGIGIGVVTAYPGVPLEDFAAPPTTFITNFDQPGLNAGTPAPLFLPASTYGLVKPAFGVAAYEQSRQHWFDLRHLSLGITFANPGAGGVGITTNVQFPNYLSGLTGTSNFLSGSSPHVDGSGANGNLLTRCDRLGMGIKMSGLPGHLVLFVVQLGGTFGPESPMTAGPVFGPPGSTGVFCLNLFQPLIALIGVPTANTLEISFPVPCSGSLSGLNIVQQAFAFHPSGLLHSTPCDLMGL